MTLQMRIYTINRGALDAWVTEWREKIKPLRLSLGFTIPGAWTIEATNQFVWLLGYDGPEPWDKLDNAFHHSRQRREMVPDPARHIARIEQHYLAPAG